jgi:hypothetical protein
MNCRTCGNHISSTGCPVCRARRIDEAFQRTRALLNAYLDAGGSQYDFDERATLKNELAKGANAASRKVWGLA